MYGCNGVKEGNGSGDGDGGGGVVCVKQTAKHQQGFVRLYFFFSICAICKFVHITIMRNQKVHTFPNRLWRIELCWSKHSL